MSRELEEQTVSLVKIIREHAEELAAIEPTDEEYVTLGDQLESLANDIDNKASDTLDQLESYEDEVTDLRFNMDTLEDDLMDKDNEIQDLQLQLDDME